MKRSGALVNGLAVLRRRSRTMPMRRDLGGPLDPIEHAIELALAWNIHPRWGVPFIREQIGTGLRQNPRSDREQPGAGYAPGARVNASKTVRTFAAGISVAETTSLCVKVKAGRNVHSLGDCILIRCIATGNRSALQLCRSDDCSLSCSAACIDGRRVSCGHQYLFFSIHASR